MISSTAGPQPVLAQFGVDAVRGFLPPTDPLTILPKEYVAWEQAAGEIPKLLAADRIRATLRGLPSIQIDHLHSEAELDRAMLLLSYLGHAFVFGGHEPDAHLPAVIAVPWAAVASCVGRPPVLSYASHALVNWRRYDVSEPVALGNIARLQNFSGGVDEDWFVLVHVAIEGSAAPALQAALGAHLALARGDLSTLTCALAEIAETVCTMLAILRHMPEKCDPYIYYNRVRQFIFGWLDNPGLPEGVFYHGVSEFSGRPRRFRGETGAQSSIIPSIDALCGIDYADDPLGSHLRELRAYMPPAHRGFIEYLRSGPSLHEYVARVREPRLSEAFNACIRSLRDFRSQHLEYAGMYIHSQSQRNKANPNTVGTGGTPFMRYLKAHCDLLNRYLVQDS